eukprot:3936279-Rhodomonas_salina.3
MHCPINVVCLQVRQRTDVVSSLQAALTALQGLAKSVMLKRLGNKPMHMVYQLCMPISCTSHDARSLVEKRSWCTAPHTSSDVGR